MGTEATGLGDGVAVSSTVVADSPQAASNALAPPPSATAEAPLSNRRRLSLGVLVIPRSWIVVETISFYRPYVCGGASVRKLPDKP